MKRYIFRSAICRGVNATDGEPDDASGAAADFACGSFAVTAVDFFERFMNRLARAMAGEVRGWAYYSSKRPDWQLFCVPCPAMRDLCPPRAMNAGSRAMNPPTNRRKS